MGNPRPKSVHCVFAVELHSNQPEQLAHFYEELLNVKFGAQTYPFPRYVAELGKLALIISDAKGQDPETASEAGKATLSLLSQAPVPESGQRYYLFPNRPLGGKFPGRYASRLRDPDGNYVALASSLEHVIGRIPTVISWREMFDHCKELVQVSMQLASKRARLRLDRMIDRCEYALNRPAFVNRDLTPYSHLVASREGLFAINSTSYKRLLRGQFFGLTVKEGIIYCFQSCGKNQLNRGRLLRITTAQNRITKVEVAAKGFDDGCHQIDFVGEDLLVVDCYNGRILQMRPGVPGYKAHYPLGQLSRKEAMALHINSVVGHPDGTIWILLHNSLKKPSEVIVLDKNFEIIKRFQTDTGGAHNIVFTNDKHEYLIADSRGGRIITPNGVVIDRDVMFFRGISLDENTCVVGDSFYATRPFRRYVAGQVHFFERESWAYKSSLSLPAAPTEIRRIDGKDLSITNYCLAQAAMKRVVDTPCPEDLPVQA